jgi:2-keto-3-deoxy-galactonokinase
VALVGEPGLCDLYAAAFTARGLTHTRHDGDEAVLAGLIALQGRLTEGAAA